jgi:triosephosphate isomerase
MAGKSIVVANWKMYPTTMREAKRLFEATKKAADSCPSVSIVVAPPAIYLSLLTASYKGKRIQFASQHVNALEQGACTGEISVAQVADSKALFVLVGHAERRALGETNEETGKKVAAALSHGLTPILCVGERERTASGEHFTFVKEQLRAAFSQIDANKVAKVIVAYEPVWAIGGDRTMTPRDMHEMVIFIRKTIVDGKGEAGMNLKILYGGSVSEENAPQMLEYGGVAGLLVGHVSVDSIRFSKLIHSIA